MGLRPSTPMISIITGNLPRLYRLEFQHANGKPDLLHALDNAIIEQNMAENKHFRLVWGAMTKDEGYYFLTDKATNEVFGDRYVRDERGYRSGRINIRDLLLLKELLKRDSEPL
jgi:hypothetical protein